jgi:lambda repressor-like predicted transcriptional regulator
MTAHQRRSDPEHIKLLIRMRGTTMSALSRRFRLSSSAVKLALQRRTSVRVERLIAEFLETKPWWLWPERYDTFGEPITCWKDHT